MTLYKAAIINIFAIIVLFSLTLGDVWNTHQPPSPVAQPPVNTERAVITRVGQDTIYAFIGPLTGTNVIWKYKATATDSGIWCDPLQTYSPRVKSSHMAWDTVSNQVHVLYNKQDNTWRHFAYDRNLKCWLGFPNPLPFRGGCASCNDLVYVRYNGVSYLYLLRNFAGVDYNFVRFNCSSGSWENRASMLQQPITGAALCWNEQTGSGSLIYAFSGTNTSSSPPPYAFYCYNVASNSWQGITNGPGYYTSAGSLAYRKNQSGTDLIYALIRVNQTYFKQYNIGSNSWTSLSGTPTPLKHGDALVYIPNTSIQRAFAFRGGTNKEFWRYVPGNLDEDGGENEFPVICDNADDENVAIQDLSWINETDCERVIFSKCDRTDDSTDQFYQIHKSLPDGSGDTAITTDSNNYFEPQWSADSNRIVCIMNDQLVIMNADGSEKNILDEDICCNPTWSPGGDWIAYLKWTFEDQNYNIYIVHPDASEKICLTDDGSNFHPQFSSDGQYIIYQKDLGDYSAIYTVSVSNPEEEEITTDEIDFGMPQWTTDGDSIICMEPDESNFYQLGKISLSTGKGVMLTNEACDHTYPQVSPGGDYVVYVKIDPDSCGSQICRMPVAGGEEEVLTDYGKIKEDPKWSPAGNLIAYIESDEGSDARKRIRVISADPITNSKHYDFLPVGRLNIAPNPFSKSICFTYTSTSLPEKLDKFNLKIYNANGRLARTIKAKRVDNNKVTYIWNGEDNTGRRLANGIYFSKLQVGKSELLRKITFLEK